jgi:hypothetical protein
MQQEQAHYSHLEPSSEPTQAFTPTPSTPDPRDDSGRPRCARCERMARRDGHRDREHAPPERLQTVPRPPNTNIITPRWVFRRKFENGALVKHKARLVARGFTQISGIDYNEAHLYAPVMRLESFRVLLSIAAWFDLDLQQFDVSAAYLHGEIDGEVYMEPPPGHEDGDSVWKLLKGLYGLKQAGRIWHERLKADMEELGYVQCQRDHAVFRSALGRRATGPCAPFGSTTRPALGLREQLSRVAEHVPPEVWDIGRGGAYSGLWE